MIKSFANKGLADLWAGRRSRLNPRLHKRILVLLDALDVAAQPADMNMGGFDFHALHGFKPTRYTVHVNGPWCITFEFSKGDAWRVDYEQYH
jgi:proteic killer suppression protein